MADAKNSDMKGTTSMIGEAEPDAADTVAVATDNDSDVNATNHACFALTTTEVFEYRRWRR